MQFVVTGHDYADTLDKRLVSRQAHIDMIDKLKAQGHFLMACALLDEEGKMRGSVLVCDFESEEALKETWLNHEPYVLNNVWEKVAIERCAVGPSFLQIVKQ